MNITIRPATRFDALHVAALIDIAGHGIEMDYWIANAGEDHAPIAAARRLTIDDESLPYHFSKSHLLECDGEIAAGLIGYLTALQSGSPPDVPAHIKPLLELENIVPGYWSVVGIAVYPEFRGRGFSRLLLDHAMTLAHDCAAKGLSIVVENSNTTALDLYRRWGFTERERRPWLLYGNRSGPREWVLLTRDL